ncbi:MAG: ABC transporter ATP-binding protein [Candidatus Omnitrophota bacterium]
MIELKNITKTFNGREVLRDVSLRINEGESMVIIGRSGCGKSVLLKHIIGLMRPDSGDVLIDGVNITKLNSRELNKVRMNFGMLFQESALFDSLSVLENVGFRLFEYTDMPLGEIKNKVAECLSMVGLEGLEYSKPSQLSGGMKKRVGLARAISMSPEIILFDEPTTGLDPIMGDIITDLIRDLRNTLKVTSVTVTHDMRSAYKIADKIAMLYDKRIIAAGSPEEIRNSGNEIVRQFITGSAEGPITGASRHPAF